MDVQVPDKLFFKIGEVADLTGVKPHVLRYWESEFAPLRPGKSRSQQRLFRRRDVELVLRLKHLLYEQGFTIAGAKKKLREAADEDDSQLALPLDADRRRALLDEIRGEIAALRDSLKCPPG